MKKLILLISTLLTLNAFPQISPENRRHLENLREDIRVWVKYCNEAMNYGPGCDQGDMMLFAGLLCLSGEKERCKDVSRSQSADGQWWRSPGKIGDEGKPMFSRDQSMGVLAYFIATKDTQAASRWLDRIIANGRRFPENDINIGSFDLGRILRGWNLSPGFTLFSVCKDDFHLNCVIPPMLWGVFGRVWSHMGLELTSPMNFGVDLNADEAAIAVEVESNQANYERHLTGVNIFLHQKLGRNNWALKNAAKTLSAKIPNNAFFKYLAEGPTDAVARMTLEQCPGQPLVNEPNDWVWMAGNLENPPFKSSMGWDCIFMANLLLNGPTPIAVTGNGGFILGTDQTLLEEQSLISPNGKYMLKMQKDGNLVKYKIEGPNLGAVWASGTDKRCNFWETCHFFAKMQSDGNFVVYKGIPGQNSKALWASNTNTTNGQFYLALQDSGVLEIHKGIFQENDLGITWVNNIN